MKIPASDTKTVDAVSGADEQSVRKQSEIQQEQHYDNIAAEYEAHYSDAASRNYRWRFIYEPMFAELELNGLSVLDAMCGSGQTTEFLLSRGASVTGLDISHEVVEQFQESWPAATVLQRSLLDSKLPTASFDCVSVVGGLHHIHPYVNEAVSEIHRLLKPGGHFCFMEPHAGSFPDAIRKVWYKHDRFFSDNEAAIDLKELESEFSSDFRFVKSSYHGNVAFLLVLNSLIFRIPAGLKPLYSPMLMPLESIIGKLQGERSSCFAVAQWQKIE